jgi:hypothetical protein
MPHGSATGESRRRRVAGSWPGRRRPRWTTHVGKLRRCTERHTGPIKFFIAVRGLIRRAWTHYRWDTRPRIR